jgi:hypothetical protein
VAALRIAAAVVAASRDSSRARGPWAVNTYVDQGRLRKRFGTALDTSGSSPGQGVLIYGTTKVRVCNDTLYVGGSSFAL